MSNNFIFTSESVTEGHPDKVADQISDTILDEFLRKDPQAKVACETLIKSGLLVLAGEVAPLVKIDYLDIVKKKLEEIGYTKKELGFDINQCNILVNINEQSKEIALGVKKTKQKKQGAGDQGLMFGYATNETKELMPLPIALAHQLAERLAEVRKKNILPYLGPDGKTQVSVEYEGGKPKRIDTIVVSAQHEDIFNKDLTRLKKDIEKEVIYPIIPENLLDNKTKYHINPTGEFTKGGPEADAGLTGRKIIVDTYGGMGRHGGGAFSGKDPSKVDRSAAYAARYIAKNIVAAGIFDECEVQLSYAIGVSEPVSINVNSFAHQGVDKKKLIDFIRHHFPLTPEDIITHFRLRRPIYAPTSVYGHFGRRLPQFLWEKTDVAKKLKQAFSK